MQEAIDKGNSKVPRTFQKADAENKARMEEFQAMHMQWNSGRGQNREKRDAPERSPSQTHLLASGAYHRVLEPSISPRFLTDAG